MYAHGDGVNQDYSQALRWYYAAAGQSLLENLQEAPKPEKYDQLPAGISVIQEFLSPADS